MKVIAILTILLHLLKAQKSCNQFVTEYDCNNNSDDACQWFGECKCASETKFDILFGIDSSGSIGLEPFEEQRQFLNKLVTHDINNNESRIGFMVFSTNVWDVYTRRIDYYNTTDLQNYISNIPYKKGYTNTPQLFDYSLDEFNRTKATDRQQVLILITDGNPQNKNGTYSICDDNDVTYASLVQRVQQSGVRVIIIGVVGDNHGLKREYVNCTCQSSEDFIPISAAKSSDFEAILPSLSSVLCPVTTTLEPSTSIPPSFICPNYWLTGGTQQQICNSERCTCRDALESKECCLDNPVWTGTYDANRKHDDSFQCKLDVELFNSKKRSQGETKAGTSPGYLLQPSTHYFAVEISPNNYPCRMNIFWKMEFNVTPESAGLSIDKTYGWLKLWSPNDKQNATIKFVVTRATCEGESCDLFDEVAIYGDLVIVNATSQCQPHCYDGRIYPMRIPIWYSYVDAFIAPPTHETELPAWLWWLIAALVTFLLLLMVLLYKYWYKNKLAAASLKATEKELGDAIDEAENGFAYDIKDDAVQINPLGHAVIPNYGNNNVKPNAPMNSDNIMPEFVTTPIVLFDEKNEYGPKMGIIR